MARTALYPLKFHPVFKSKVWGGRRLAAWGKRLPPGTQIGESWELADRPDDRSVIANGPLAGLTLHEVLRKRRGELLGAVADRAIEEFPILIKMIHAREDLSIQVHPDDAAARRFSGLSYGKVEAWHVLEARPGATMIFGLKPRTTRSVLKSAVRNGCVPGLVRRVPVRRGDTLLIEPGIVHAIGAGIVLLEVQQNTDITYRLYDWGRLASHGRRMHVEESLGSIRYGARPARVIHDRGRRRQRLVQCDRFEIELRRGEFEEQINAFRGLSIVRGRGRLQWEDGRQCCAIRRGETILIPASVGRYRVEGRSVEALVWKEG